MTDKPTDATIDAASKICNNMGLGLHAVIIMLNTNLNKAKRQLAEAEASNRLCSANFEFMKNEFEQSETMWRGKATQAQARLDDENRPQYCICNVHTWLTAISKRATFECPACRADKLQVRLAELQDRHECLKSLYEDATNCKDPAQAETDIDEFIREEQLHS